MTFLLNVLRVAFTFPDNSLLPVQSFSLLVLHVLFSAEDFLSSISQFLSFPSKILARSKKYVILGTGGLLYSEEIDEINKLFYDAKSSAKILAEQEDKYMK